MRTPYTRRVSGMNRRPTIKAMPVMAIRMTVGHPHTSELIGLLMS